MLLELIATLCAGLFAGAAIYITFVEHPARLECGTALAATEFGPSYRRAAVMQASLAAVGFVASVVAWWDGRGLDPSLDRASPQAAALLARWGRLHAVHSVLSGVAFGVLAWHLARPG